MWVAIFLWQSVSFSWLGGVLMRGPPFLHWLNILRILAE
jgi:hypothetical protein